MFFLKKKKKEAMAISVEELETAISRFLYEQKKKNPNISYQVLFDENGNICYNLLKPFLPCIPTNQFIGTKHTFEFFEDTEKNQKKVRLIDHVQESLDDYVNDKDAFPVKENSRDFEICYMKLRPFLKEVPDFPLYLLPDYYLVHSEPKASLNS